MKTTVAVVILTSIALLRLVPAFAAVSSGGQLTAEVANLTAQIESGQQEITSLDARLEATTKDIIQTYQRLDAEESDLTRQRQALNVRLQEVYKNYDEMLIGIFLSARSFTDIWKRFAFLAKINQADNQLLSANRFRVEQVKQLKLELSGKKQEQIELKRKKQIEYLNLQAALAQKKVLLEEKIRQALLAQQAAQASAGAVAATAATPVAIR